MKTDGPCLFTVDAFAREKFTKLTYGKFNAESVKHGVGKLG